MNVLGMAVLHGLPGFVLALQVRLDLFDVPLVLPLVPQPPDVVANATPRACLADHPQALASAAALDFAGAGFAPCYAAAFEALECLERTLALG